MDGTPQHGEREKESCTLHHQTFAKSQVSSRLQLVLLSCCLLILGNVLCIIYGDLNKEKLVGGWCAASHLTLRPTGIPHTPRNLLLFISIRGRIIFSLLFWKLIPKPNFSLPCTSRDVDIYLPSHIMSTHLNVLYTSISAHLNMLHTSMSAHLTTAHITAGLTAHIPAHQAQLRSLTLTLFWANYWATNLSKFA